MFSLPKIISSATRPPNRLAILAFNSRSEIAQAVAFGQIHGEAQSTAARDDRDLVQGLMTRCIEHHDGMAALVIGGELLLVLGHDHGAAFRTHHDLVLGVLEAPSW